MKIDGVEIPDEKLIEAGWVSPAKKVLRERWRAEENGKYWYAHDIGDVMRGRECGYYEDDVRYLLGNYYRTKEEVEKARDKQIAYMRLTDALLKYNDGWDPKWLTDLESRYTICYNKYSRYFYPISVSGEAMLPVLYGQKYACERLIVEHEDDLRTVWGLE